MSTIFMESTPLTITIRDADENNLITIYTSHGNFASATVLLEQCIVQGLNNVYNLDNNNPNISIDELNDYIKSLNDNQWRDCIKQIVKHNNKYIKQMNQDPNAKNKQSLISVYQDNLAQQQLIENTHNRIIVNLHDYTVDYSQLYISDNINYMNALLEGINKHVKAGIGLISDLDNKSQIAHLSLNTVLHIAESLKFNHNLVNTEYIGLETEDKKKMWFFVNM